MRHWCSSIWTCLCTLVVTLAFLFGTGLFRPSQVSAAAVTLRPPFNGTYRLTSFFDHNYPNYVDDNEITIYTGESVTDFNPHSYAGHNGYDWAMSNGTPVLAAAGGLVIRAQWWGGYGNQIVIEHGNGYYTMYAHLQGFNVQLGQTVAGSDLIGWSDNTGNSTGPHLHFTVYRGGLVDDENGTDPFGWRGSGPAPLRNWPSPGQGHTAACLWRGPPGDFISCFDHIVEDHFGNGGGWSQSGPWTTSTAGNGWLEHHTGNWDPPWSNAQWDSRAGGHAPILYHGYYRLSAFIPAVSSRTANAQYDVHYYYNQVTTVSGNQATVTDNWLSLGTYELEPDASYCYVYLDDYTGEQPIGSRNVVADALKFSAGVTYLPTVRNAGNRTSWIYIRNLSESEAAQATISWYYDSGGRYTFYDMTIPVKGTKTQIPPGNFNGSAVLVSDQDVAVAVSTRSSSGVVRHTAYTGISEANWSSGWGQPDGWDSLRHHEAEQQRLCGRLQHALSVGRKGEQDLGAR